MLVALAVLAFASASPDVTPFLPDQAHHPFAAVDTPRWPLVTAQRRSDPLDEVVVHLIRRCGSGEGCLKPQVIDLLRAEAARIWAANGLRLVWVEPERAAHRGVQVDVVAILDENAAPLPGWTGQRRFVLAALNPPLEPGGTALARVSVPQARRLVAAVRVGERPYAALLPHAQAVILSRALGRALAHEIGHAVLGTAAHSPRGLMRAVFRPNELLDPSVAAYRLLPDHRPVAPARVRAAR